MRVGSISAMIIVCGWPALGCAQGAPAPLLPPTVPAAMASQPNQPPAADNRAARRPPLPPGGGSMRDLIAFLELPSREVESEIDQPVTGYGNEALWDREPSQISAAAQTLHPKPATSRRQSR